MGMTETQEEKSLLRRARAYIRPVLLGALAGAAATAVLLCLLALAFGLLHVTGSAIPAAAILIAVAGGFAAGIAGAKLRKKRGMLTGGCSALLLAGGLLLAGVLSSGMPGAAALTRAAVIIVAGMVGGVLGVNGKRDRRI